MRIKGSIIVASVIALAAAGWILSGQVSDQPANAEHGPPPAAAEMRDPGPTRVRVRTSDAQDYVAAVTASGQTEAARTVEIRAETTGRVKEVGVEKGAAVERGARIVTLDEAERPAALAEARARVNQRRIQYEAARKLAEKGFQAETRRAEALADLEAAKARQRSIEVDLDRTGIDAPFAGVLDRRPVEIGDYVQAGDHVATIVELNPILVTAQVSEREAPFIEEGMQASARLPNGSEFPGIVTYVASVGDPATRTFRVEVEVANPGNRLGEGLTAEIRVPLRATPAHRVSPSIFRLDDRGQLGVMVVDGDDMARFNPVKVVGTDSVGAWVTGLPGRVRLIVVGQELVADGDRVMPVPVDAESGGATS